MQAAARLDQVSSVAELCRALGTTYWGRRPVVLGHAEDLLGTARDIRDGLRVLGQRGELPRLYVDGKPVRPTAADACTATDPSIEAYVERLARAHAAAQITCIVKDLETSHDRIWFGCARLLRALYDAVGFPAGNASLSLFAGRYGKTPFGCHKDVDDILTYVISGRKRYLVWPFELIANHLGIPEAVRNRAAVLETFDYDELRDQATVLEGGPGDLLYWPWDHWHVAESDGDPTASLSLGIEPLPIKWALPESAEDALDRRTRFAFRAPLPVAAGEPLSDDDWLRPPLPDLIACHEEPERLLVSVNGHGFSVDPRPGLVALFGELSRGEPVQVGELIARHHELLDREELAQILECLVAFRGFAHEPIVPKPLSANLFRRSDWHPLRLAGDGETLELALIAEHQHRRVEGAVIRGFRAPLEAVLALADAEQPAGRQPRYLFTAGYSGSTLISRCIEAIAHCWTVNEPRVLDDWAMRDGAIGDAARAGCRRVLDLLAILLFRANHPDGKVVVKGGEGATGIMAELLAAPRATGILLYTALPVFLASTLKAEARRAEFRRVVRSPQRLRRARQLGLPTIDPDALSDARAIAHAWMTDLALYRDLHDRPGSRLRALDFDGFLAAPAHGVRALADHLELGLPPGGEQTICDGEVFRSHAKHAAAFDRRARAAALAAQCERHRAEIAEAVEFCTAVWGGEPPARFPGDLLTAAP